MVRWWLPSHLRRSQGMGKLNAKNLSGRLPCQSLCSWQNVNVTMLSICLQFDVSFACPQRKRRTHSVPWARPLHVRTISKVSVENIGDHGSHDKGFFLHESIWEEQQKNCYPVQWLSTFVQTGVKRVCCQLGLYTVGVV